MKAIALVNIEWYCTPITEVIGITASLKTFKPFNRQLADCEVPCCTGERAVIDSPGDGGSGHALGMAGQGQALALVQRHIARQLLEGGSHVDGQADFLARGAGGIHSHAGEHTGVTWLPGSQ